MPVPKPDMRAPYRDDPRLRLALDISRDAMATAGVDGCWRESNPVLGRLLGRGAAQLRDTPVLDALPPAEPAVAADWDALLAGRCEALAWRAAPTGAGLEPGQALAVDARVLRDRAGAPDGALLLVRAEADAADRQLRLFAETLAHDLRAPLRTIDSFSRLLQERAGTALDDTGRDHLARIRAAAARMDSLLVALGELSTANHAELHPGPLDLSLLADWAAVELQQAQPLRAPVEFRIQPELAGWGDERLIRLALTQLLDNAWKFSGDGPAVVEVAGRVAHGMLDLQVRDHGCGFDMRYARRLFEPFQRLHGPEEGGGHGIGLAVAQRIAERHRGRIRVESVPGTGSTFHLELPAHGGER